MSTPEPVPESFLARVLGEFGLQWAHLAVFSGVAFSAFGLDQYFNTGAWLVASVASLSAVFLVRRDVSSRFIIVAIASIVVAISLIGLGAWWAGRGGSVGDFLKGHKTMATVYLAAATIVPLGIMMISYRRREDFHGGPFPTSIKRAIQTNIVDMPFYVSNMQYDLTVLEVAPRYTKIKSVLSYTVHNRTKILSEFPITFTPVRDRVEFISARVGSIEIDLDNPAYRRQSGLQLSRSFSPGQPEAVRLEADIWYRTADSDLLASYISTTDFTLVLNNPFPELKVMVESLFRQDLTPTIDGQTRTYKSEGGTVPYQGFKLDWVRR